MDVKILGGNAGYWYRTCRVTLLVAPYHARCAAPPVALPCPARRAALLAARRPANCRAALLTAAPPCPARHAALLAARRPAGCRTALPCPRAALLAAAPPGACPSAAPLAAHRHFLPARCPALPARRPAGRCAALPCPTLRPVLAWLTRDATARLAVRNHLPLAERAHFGQHKTVKALYDAVVARYSSPATAALGRLLLPYLFPELSAFATVEDLITHLRTRDTRYRAALKAEFLDKNPPPMYITLYFIGTRLLDSLRAVRDHFFALDPTDLTVNLLEKHLLAAETSVVAVGAARGTPRTPLFEGCSPSPLAPSYASAAALDILGTKDVRAASAPSGKRRSGKGKGGKSGGGGSGGGGRRGGGSGGVGGVGGGSGGSGGGGGGGSGSGGGGSGGGRGGAVQRGEAAALGASESALPGTAPAEALHTFTLDSDASRCFFRDSTTLIPLPAPVTVRLADPSGDLVLARSTTVLPCPAVLSGSLSRLHLPSFSTNMVSTAALQDGHYHDNWGSGSRPLFVSPPVAPDSPLSPLSWSPLPATPPWHALPPPCFWSSQVSASPPALACPALPSLRRGAAVRRSSLLFVSPDVCSPADTPHGHGEVPDVLIPWIRAVRLQLRERFREHLPVLRLHSDRGGEFSSDLLRDFCRGEGILQSFTLPASPHKNGVAEHHPLPLAEPIEVTVHSSAAGGGAARGAKRESAKPGGAEPEGAESGGAEPESVEPGGAEPEGSEPGGAESESAEPGGAEPKGTESGGAEPRGTVSAGGLAVASPLQSRRREPLSPRQLREWFARRTRLRGGAIGAGGPATEDIGVGGAGATSLGGAGVTAGAGGVGAGGTGGVGAAGPGGACTRGTGAAGAVGVGGAGAGDPSAGGAGAGGAGARRTGAGVSEGAGAAGPRGARTRGTRAARAGGVGGAGAGDPGAGGTGAGGTGAGDHGAGGTGVGGTGAGGPGAGGARAGDAGAGGAGTGGAGAGGTGAGGTVQRRPFFVPPPPSSLPPPSLVLGQRPPPVLGTHIMALHPSSVPLRVPLPSPPTSSRPDVPGPESDLVRAASPTVIRLLAPVVTDPSFESTAASALVAELVDFAATCRLDYAACLVAESASDCPPSVAGECALGTDVLEERQEEFECLAATVPHLVAMLLAPEGDPDAPDIPTPRSYAYAITGPYSSQWQIAMDAEMASLKSTCTYVDTVSPHGANIVDGMWIFKVKRPPGSSLVFKARYVARGFSQRQGVDFFQTFSPTPKMTTLWVLLHIAAQRDYKLHSLDFSTTCLQGSLHEEIWLRRPPGFTGSFLAGTQWSLRRPVYGLRQAPREWHDTLRTTLAALGFALLTADPSLLLRTDSSLPLFYTLVYIEDLVFASADTKALALVKSELQKRHTCTDLVELRSYLGLQITRDMAGHTITLTQSHMVHQSVEPSGPYPELVGCLMYLMTCTRPDLAYPLSILARYVTPGRHRPEHWEATKRVLRYLCSTSGMGLVLGGRGPVVLTGHADAFWVDDLATQRSSQGYTLRLGSGSVSLRSTCSSSVLSFSCEVEIYAGAMAAQELRWLTYMLTDLGERPHSPPVLYVDNKAMIALCQEHRLEHRTKHTALRYFLARKLQQRGQLRLAYVATWANTADILTKALQPCDHQRFCTVLGLFPVLSHLLTA
ncbi:unnamed protein product [Closterium sp. NIES-53]